MKFCVSDGGILENQKPFQLEMWMCFFKETSIFIIVFPVSVCSVLLWRFCVLLIFFLSFILSFITSFFLSVFDFVFYSLVLYHPISVFLSHFSIFFLVSFTWMNQIYLLFWIEMLNSTPQAKFPAPHFFQKQENNIFFPLIFFPSLCFAFKLLFFHISQILCVAWADLF